MGISTQYWFFHAHLLLLSSSQCIQGAANSKGQRLYSPMNHGIIGMQAWNGSFRPPTSTEAGPSISRPSLTCLSNLFFKTSSHGDCTTFLSNLVYRLTIRRKFSLISLPFSKLSLFLLAPSSEDMENNQAWKNQILISKCQFLLSMHNLVGKHFH